MASGTRERARATVLPLAGDASTKAFFRSSSMLARQRSAQAVRFRFMSSDRTVVPLSLALAGSAPLKSRSSNASKQFSVTQWNRRLN
jgi:hypothetical protein